MIKRVDSDGDFRCIKCDTLLSIDFSEREGRLWCPVCGTSVLGEFVEVLSEKLYAFDMVLSIRLRENVDLITIEFPEKKCVINGYIEG